MEKTKQLFGGAAWALVLSLFPALAPADPPAPTAPPAPSALTVVCDLPTGVYASGQPTVFTVTRTEPGAAAPAATVRILRNNKEEVYKEEVPGAEKSHAVRFVPPSDDWYFCSVTLAGEKKPAATTGIVVNPDHYAPSMSTPDDFDAFWKTQKDRLTADKAAPKLDPLTPGQRALETQNPEHLKRIEALEKEGYAGFNLEIPCLDVRPVEGYYARPKAAVPGGHPAILYVHAAGVAGTWCRSSYMTTINSSSRYNAIVLDMNAHGMLNGQPQAYYDDLEKGPLANYRDIGKDDREKSYFLGMFLRLERGIDFLATRPEWDGKHLIVVGVSQGGAQALVAGGLDQRVSAVVATVPWLCDLTGSLVGRPVNWPDLDKMKPGEEELKKKVADAVRYFDAANFNPRSRAETLVTVGFVDTSCMAPGIFTAYNQLKGPKRIITVPDKGHIPLSSSPPELRAQYDAFIADHGKN